MKRTETHGARKIVGKIFYGILGFFAVFFTTASFILIFMMGADLAVESSARVLPSYEKTDLTEVLQKEEWTEEDFTLLYRQTGLGKAPLLELKDSPYRILRFQEALFYPAEIKHVDAAPTTPHDYTDYSAPIIPLQDGDVFVTSTCHTFGWRNGHSALVTDAQTGMLFQSIAPGYLSQEEGTYWFKTAANFMVLRLKDVSKEERAEIARKAKEKYMNVPYSLTVGIFSPKDQSNDLQSTNCSHLVWQSYKLSGYDIDSDGGAICTSRDIANSPLFEVVQVYGFDVDKLWK